MRLSSLRGLLFVVPAILSACGGGGGGGEAGPAHLLRGVVVGNAPAASAQVKVKDATGATVSATTDATGHYSVDLGSMTGPFRLEAVVGAVKLHSLAAAEGTANITTLTNLVLDTASQTRGTTATAVFDATTATVPSATEVSDYNDAIRAIVAPALSADGVSSSAISTFDPVTTAFETSGTGIDLVVRNCVVGTDGSGNTTLTVKNDASGSAYSATSTVTVTSDPSGANSSADFQTTTSTNTTAQPSPPASQTCSPPTGVLQFSASTYSASESAGSVTITVTRTGGSAGAASVSYATSDGTGVAGTDYTAASGTLNWVSGDATSKTFAVSIADRGLTSGTHTVNLALSGASGASAGSPASAVLTINDNDAAGSLQFSASTYSVTEDGGSVTITVTRTGGSAGAASVNFATSNGTGVAGTDYTAASGTLNWANGDAAAKTFSVTVAHNSATTSARTVNLALSGASGAAAGSPVSATLSITNTDVASATTQFVPVLSATGVLSVVDMADPTHPIQVDTGVTDSGNFPDHGDQIHIAYDLSGTTVSNLRRSRLVYVKGGKVFKVNLEAGASHAAVQISSITDACDVSSSKPEDNHNPDNGGVIVHRACGTGSDHKSLIRMNALTSDGGIDLGPGVCSSESIRDPSGNILGLLTAEMNAGHLALVQRDANFANPVVLASIDLNPAGGSCVHYAFTTLSRVSFVAFTPAGSGTWQLFAFNQDATPGTGLSSSLYTFGTASAGGCVDCDYSHDSNNIYFGDGLALKRLAVTATTAGNVQTVSTCTSGVANNFDLVSGSTRIAFTCSSGTPTGVLTADRAANNAAPTTVVASTNFTKFAEQGGFVYVNTIDGSNIPHAVRAAADGSSSTTIDDANWQGLEVPDTFDTSTGIGSGNFSSPAFLLTTGLSTSTMTLKAYDPSSGTVGATLGSLSGMVPGVGFAGGALGTKGLLYANMDRAPSHDDDDIYFFDLSAANSLTPVLTTTGSDDFIDGLF